MVSNALNQNFGGKTGSKFDSSILPNSIEAEQAVIGAIIVDPDAFSRVIDVIDSSEYF